MGLFDNFKLPQSTPSAPSVPVASPAPVTASAAQNPTVPSASNTPVANVTNPDGSPNHAASASPLAQFSELWKNDPNAVPTKPFAVNSDPAKVLEAARNVDFTKALTPELNQRIQAGGVDAQSAMVEAMNNVAQLTFAQSTHASAKIVEQALIQQQEAFEARLPDIIKRHAVSDSLRDTNPLMTNPAMAPMVDALQQQFTRKYPTATASEIKAHVNEYLNGAADLITGQRPQPTVKQGRKTEDWSIFMGE